MTQNFCCGTDLQRYQGYYRSLWRSGPTEWTKTSVAVFSEPHDTLGILGCCQLVTGWLKILEIYGIVCCSALYVPLRYSSKQLMLLARAGRPGWLRAFQGIFGHLLPIELLFASLLEGIHLLKRLNVTWFLEIARVFMIEYQTQKTALLCLALLSHLRMRLNKSKYWWLCPEKSIQFLFKISNT